MKSLIIVFLSVTSYFASANAGDVSWPTDTYQIQYISAQAAGKALLFRFSDTYSEVDECVKEYFFDDSLTLLYEEGAGRSEKVYFLKENKKAIYKQNCEANHNSSESTILDKPKVITTKWYKLPKGRNVEVIFPKGLSLEIK